MNRRMIAHPELVALRDRLRGLIHDCDRNPSYVKRQLQNENETINAWLADPERQVRHDDPDLLADIAEFLEPRMDVVDGPDGTPAPDAAMSLYTRTQLARGYRP